MRRIMSSFPGKRSASAPPQNKRPDLISTDDGPPTHPSEHNSVVVNESGAQGRRKLREEKNAQALAKRAKASEEGKADPWSVVQERHAKANTHAAAFQAPQPYWGVSDFYGAHG